MENIPYQREQTNEDINGSNCQNICLKYEINFESGNHKSHLQSPTHHLDITRDQGLQDWWSPFHISSLFFFLKKAKLVARVSKWLLHSPISVFEVNWMHFFSKNKINIINVEANTFYKTKSKLIWPQWIFFFF